MTALMTTPYEDLVHPRAGKRDALYELEMYRALLSAARQQDSPPELIRGLDAEVKYWLRQVEKELQGVIPQRASRRKPQPGESVLPP